MSADFEQRLAVLEAAVERLQNPGPGFLEACRFDQFRSGLQGPSPVRITHLPTGIVVDGLTRGEAVRKLAEILFARGDITVNDGRRALGLPEWQGEWADTAQAMREADCS